MVSETETRMEAALMQRDAAMMLLIAQAQGLVQQLALLAGSEKAAVAGLVAVGQAMVAYARATRPDAEVLASFDHVLAALSPGVAGRLTAIRSAAPSLPMRTTTPRVRRVPSRDCSALWRRRTTRRVRRRTTIQNG